MWIIENWKRLSTSWKVIGILGTVLGIITVAFFGGFGTSLYNHYFGTTTITSQILHSVAVVVYNSTTYPNHYSITIQNEGANESNGFAFTINLLNSQSFIKSLKTMGEGIGIMPSLLYNNQSAYIVVPALSPGTWATLKLNLTAPSKLYMQVNTPNSPACYAYIYNINGTQTNESTANMNYKLRNAIQSGNCNSTVFNNLIYNLDTIQQNKLHLYGNCSSIQVLQITSNGSIVFPFPLSTLQKLEFFVYKDNQLINTLYSKTTFFLNLTESLNNQYSNDVYEVYTPGNQNYSCADTVIQIVKG